MDDYILKRQKLQIFFPSQKLEVTFERTTKLSALSIPTIRRCHKLYLLSYFLSILHIYLKHLFILFIYLFIYYFPPSTVRRPPSAVHRPPSAILRPPSAVRRPFPARFTESCKLADFSSLKAILLGSVILKSEYKKAYQKEINRTWNAVIRTRQPCAFVRVASVEDVANTVKFCVHNKVG